VKALLFAESGTSAAGQGPAKVGTLLVTRTFEAPQERLFRAWTEATALARWWGEPGQTLVRTLAVRPGGGIHLEMFGRGADSVSAIGTVREVTWPAQLVFSLASEWTGESGRDEMLYTVTMAEHESLTHVVLHGRCFGSAANSNPRTMAARNVEWERRFERLNAALAYMGRNSLQGQ
jgi:uncharacterized protein YndB with AHSA1/START domain